MKIRYVVLIVLLLVAFLAYQHCTTTEKLKALRGQLKEAKEQITLTETKLSEAQAKHAAEMAQRNETIAILQGAVDSYVGAAASFEGHITVLEAREKQLLAAGAGCQEVLLNVRAQLAEQKNVSLSWKNAYDDQVKITAEWVGKYTSLEGVYAAALKDLDAYRNASVICDEISKEAGKVIKKQRIGIVGGIIFGFVLGVAT